eukprot:6202570-Pleurochrysis_carterae.AAC.1
MLSPSACRSCLQLFSRPLPHTMCMSEREWGWEKRVWWSGDVAIALLPCAPRAEPQAAVTSLAGGPALRL